MAKLKIYGKSDPSVGIKEYYSIYDLFGNSAPVQFTEPNFHNIPDDQIKWSIWTLLGGSWIKTEENNKTGATVEYTFSPKSLKRKGIRMLVDINGEKAVLDIKTKQAVESKIMFVELLDINKKKPTQLFSYGQTIVARVHCVNMEKFPIYVTLWEDDGGKGKENATDIKIDEKKGNILDGIVDVEFYLDPARAWLANIKPDANASNEGAFHEYYVTAEFYKKVSKPSNNVNVINSDYKNDPYAQKPAPKQQEPETKKETQTPAEKKGPSQKEQKGIAKSDRKAYDYAEKKVAVNTTVSFDPTQNFIESMMKVGSKDSIWNKDHKKDGCQNCAKDITVKQFKDMFPNTRQLFYKGTNTLSETTIQEFVNALNNTFKEFKINTCMRKAFFLAQIARETGDFSRIDENLNYNTEDALHVYWSRKNHPLLYSHGYSFLNNPQKLGNYVYRNIGENLDEGSGDGYKFRGRGLIQITRKKGYRRFGEYSRKNLMSDPDLLLNDLDLMVRSSGWYWNHGVLLKDGTEKDLNTLADLEDFSRTTELVHGSTADVKERENIFNKIKPILKTNECRMNNAEILSDADVEYHIFYTGVIRYKIQNDKRENASYFYHDQLGEIHNIGKYNLKRIANNYGNDYCDRLGSSNIYLIDIRNLKNYEKGHIKFGLKMNPGTNRFFMNDVTIASFMGAMLDCGYSDFIFNGFSDDFGNSIGGSESHKNGMNGDLRYLRKDKSGKNVYLSLAAETGDPCGWKGMDEKRQTHLMMHFTNMDGKVCFHGGIMEKHLIIRYIM